MGREVDGVVPDCYGWENVNDNGKVFLGEHVWSNCGVTNKGRRSVSHDEISV